MASILVTAAFRWTAKTLDLNLCFKRGQRGIETILLHFRWTGWP